MSVYVNNITINTGEYFSRDFYLDNIDGTPLNLVGYAGSSYIRKHPESLIPTAKFNLSFVDRSNGRIRVSLASSITAAIKPGRYVYDVLFVDNTTKKSIVIEGNVLATEDISTECITTSYPNNFGGLVYEEDGTRVGQLFDNHVQTFAEIKPSQIFSYGVVRLGFWSNCGSLATHRTLVNNNLDTILSYVTRGGVLIVNGEHGGCGDAANQNEIFSLLGSEIRCVGQSIGIQGLAPKNASISGLDSFPDNYNFAASDHFTGGTAIYSSGANGTGNRFIVFEKIGFGAVVATADVNTFTNNNTTFAGPGPHPNDTLYNAWRSLVTNF